jgi:hypothetical protein
MSIDSKRYRCQGADKIITVLNKLKTPQQAMSLPELLEEVNKNIPLRKNKLNYTNIRRLVRNVEYNEIDNNKLGSFQDKKDRKIWKYYVISSKNSSANSKAAKKKSEDKKVDIKSLNKKAVVNNSNKNSSLDSKSKKIESSNEESYYPEILKFLNRNNIFDGESFLFKVWGGKRINGKWQNPDLLGVNAISEGKQQKVISVEVKIDTKEDQILVGIAQCCIYRTFSDYVLFFCKIDGEKQRDLFNKVMNICIYYGIGLRINDENKYIVFPQKTGLDNSNISISRRLYEEFHK